MAQLKNNPSARYDRIKTHLKLLREQSEPEEYERYLTSLQELIGKRIEQLHANWAAQLTYALQKIWTSYAREQARAKTAAEFYDDWTGLADHKPGDLVLGRHPGGTLDKRPVLSEKKSKKEMSSD